MAEARPVERNANALEDDPDWCGHPMVDVQVWRCQTCGRAVTPATRTRMERAPTVAPVGKVWVLVEGMAQMWADRFPGGGGIVGVFSDRAKIGRLLVREWIIDAASLRERLARIEWFQSAFNPDCIEGWGYDEHGDEVSYGLGLHRIDACD